MTVNSTIRSETLCQPNSRAPRHTHESTAHSRLAGWIFVFGGPLLIAFWSLLLTVYIVDRTYVGNMSPREFASDAGRLESVWAWLLIATLAWAIVNLYWSVKAIRRYSPRGFYSHFAITIGCGLIAIGIQAVMLTRSVTMQPLVLDYSGTAGRIDVSPPAPAPTTPSAGDAIEGRKVFSTICITCHGPTGQGMPNLAPSLVGSQFIQSGDDAAIAAVIRSGRTIGEPGNKSGKVMPARGGNPFLTENQIVHLVAFVKSIQRSGVNIDSGPTAAPPTVQLARWVVPTATAPPSGFDTLAAGNEDRGGDALANRLVKRRQSLMRGLTLALTSVHGLFLLGVVVLSSHLILPNLTTGKHASNPLLSKISMAGWLIAAVAWIVVAIVCFWWN